MKRTLSFLVLLLPLIASAQLHDGTYPLEMKFNYPKPELNLTYGVNFNKIVIVNNIANLSFELKISDPKTAQTNHGILKGNASGPVTGNHLKLEGNAVFDTYEKGNNDMHTNASVVLLGDFPKGKSAQPSGTFDIEADGTPLFKGTYEAVAGKQMSFRLARGSAKILHASGGDFVTAIAGADIPLFISDKIVTGENSRGEITYSDGSQFKVKSGTTITLLAAGLHLFAGEAWFSLQKQGSAFQVVTPTSVAGVLGTEFIIKADKESTIIHLLKGRLSVSDKIGNKVILETGQAVKTTVTGLGSVVGFDENEVKKSFGDDEGTVAGNKAVSLISGNTMLVIGALLAGALIVILVIVIIRKSVLTKEKAAKVQKAPVPGPLPAKPVNSYTTAQPQTHTIQQPAVQNAAYCTLCGCPLIPNAKFCDSCGTKVG